MNPYSDRIATFVGPQLYSEAPRFSSAPEVDFRSSRSLGFLLDPIQWRYGKVPYVWPYFVAIFPATWALFRPIHIYIYGRYLQSIESWPCLVDRCGEISIAVIS